MIFNDNIARPYIYIITFNETGEYYIGYRESNVNLGITAINDIGITYFTSSLKIKAKGFANTTIEILNEFEGANAGDTAFDNEQQLIWQFWGDPLLLNGQVRIHNGKKRFKYVSGSQDYKLGKSRIDIFGKEKADKITEKCRKSMLGKNTGPRSEKTIQLIREKRAKQIITEETKQKMRNSHQKRLKNKLKITTRTHNRKENIIKKIPVNKRNMAGSNNHMYDHTVYNWINIDGIEESCTKYDLYTKYGLNKSNVQAVASGSEKSIKGWKLKLNQ